MVMARQAERAGQIQSSRHAGNPRRPVGQHLGKVRRRRNERGLAQHFIASGSNPSGKRRQTKPNVRARRPASSLTLENDPRRRRPAPARISGIRKVLPGERPEFGFGPAHDRYPAALAGAMLRNRVTAAEMCSTAKSTSSKVVNRPRLRRRLARARASDRPRAFNT